VGPFLPLHISTNLCTGFSTAVDNLDSLHPPHYPLKLASVDHFLDSRSRQAMNRTLSTYEFYDDDDDYDHRRSRFNEMGSENGSAALRERATSQPPRATGDTHPSLLPSPPPQHHLPSSLGGPWSTSRNSLNHGRGQPTQIRSSSYTSQPLSNFGSAMRDRPFPSTFEDDESEALSDTYDDRFLPPSNRGRPILNHDSSKSRSQSLAPKQGPIGSIPLLDTTTAMQSWNESYLSSTAVRPSGTSRHGPLGINIAVGRPDVSNISPLTRDVRQIILDDGPFRELWAGMNPPRDEIAGGGGSGTTSRRHSVSFTQRRSNIVGFNAPSPSEEQKNRAMFVSSFSKSPPGNGARSGGLMLSDDDLASDLGMMNLSPTIEPKSHQQPLSQPSSLPIFAPHSRSPTTRDILSPYQSINLSIPGNTYSRQVIGTPSDNGYDPADSPSISTSVFEQRLADARTAHQQQQQAELRFQILQQQQQQLQQQQQQQQQQHLRSRAPSYSGSSGGLQSPISPSASRVINPQQPPYYPQTRKYSEGHVHQQQPPTPSTPLHPHTPSNLAELGKGLPLHSVPPSWPLFIVEFKAGRTDLFYLPPLGTHSGSEWDNVSPDRDIRVGDLVIVEADRGKDLGKVVNDRITLEEVEAFQRLQAEKAAVAAVAGIGSQGEPTSPGGGSQGDGGSSPHSQKKDINPKLIYGKAGPQDVQLYAAKTQDEIKALQFCQSKVRAKKLPMEVIDAEYQWCVSQLGPRLL